MASLLTIAEVAERTGLTAHTLRYYERAGLIAPVARAPGGQRRYAASDLDWIGFLLRLRETRMPIGQMQDFARLRSVGNASMSERRVLLEQHLAQVLASISTLQQAAGVLQTKIAHYEDLEASLRPTTPSTEGKRLDPPIHSNTSTRDPLHPRPAETARDRRPGR